MTAYPAIRRNPVMPPRQRGIALATALIFLVVITLLGLVAMRTSTTELRLARNEQVRMEAMQTAQSVVDTVLADSDNFPLTMDLDAPHCFASGGGDIQALCPPEQTQLTLSGPDQPLPPLFQKGIHAEVRRLPPDRAPLPGGLLTSMARFSGAAFAVRGQYSRSQAGQGAADIEQGVIKLVPRQERIR